MTVDDTSQAVVRTRAHAVLGVTFHTSPRTRLALAYTSLRRVVLDESGAVTLTFTDFEIMLRGKGLEQLPEDFILHKVLRVQLSARADVIASEEGEQIDSIDVRRTAQTAAPRDDAPGEESPQGTDRPAARFVRR